VARIYDSGCKFDEMLVLVGKQGTGKSSLLARLGGRWFSDSLKSFENKEAGEHLQNGWIFEIGEMHAMKKTEVEHVKAFLSKTEDRYRVAYDRQVSEFPRKCVFFGTTNNKDFLTDDTGNRRFWPVDISIDQAKYNQWTHLTDEVVRQIWAEALVYYRSGESLTLDSRARADAEVQQEAHYESDPREGTIREWLEAEIEDDMGQPTGQKRQRVCAAQVWVECLHKRIGDLTKWESRVICGVLRNAPGWKERNGRARIEGYGQVIVFEREK
jgi:predicted P-loop ATPase